MKYIFKEKIFCSENRVKHRFPAANQPCAANTNATCWEPCRNTLLHLLIKKAQDKIPLHSVHEFRCIPCFLFVCVISVCGRVGGFALGFLSPYLCCILFLSQPSVLLSNMLFHKLLWTVVLQHCLEAYLHQTSGCVQQCYSVFLLWAASSITGA